MWPFLSHTLFPPPTKAWLQSVSTDSEAQGWGAWSRAQKPPLGPGDGDRKEEEPGETEGDQEDGDAGFLLSLVAGEDLAEYPAPDQELEAIKLKLRAMEQAQGLETPGPQGQAAGEEGAGTPYPTLSVGCPCPGTPKKKVGSDHRSVYVGNVNYRGTAHWGTILCDNFSGHPQGVSAKFATKSLAQATVELDESGLSLRLQVLPKRTSLPGISSTDREGLRGQRGAGAGPFPRSSLPGRARGRARGRNRWAGPRGEGATPWLSTCVCLCCPLSGQLHTSCVWGQVCP
uniref:PABPN1 like, cytoplasmic n=1 Tax=Ailuropoda melanoleuca TaxID=9646 RepID=A0A7N5P6G6_AILME